MELNLDDYFPEKYFCSLKEASIDTANDIYLVNNGFKVMKIDDYNKSCYQKEMNHFNCLRGGDACFVRNNKIYIIEFKNTYLNQRIVYEILEKMYDSCIVLMDKLNISISDFKTNVNFVTVYTFKENCEEINLYDEIDKIQNRGMNKIKNAVARRSTKKIKEIDKKAFGLKKLEKYIYSEVSAIPVDYFQKYLQEENII
ncbi:hypothetical protein [Longibaculum muris]|uniref:hypothetical protein n=1 Tax=Longibaculum muris TaxID=1796628 RepID=UPI0022E6FB0F|nr:hypothetical protein [Longibaculum muris]